jgi:hypothetical protein
VISERASPASSDLIMVPSLYPIDSGSTVSREEDRGRCSAKGLLLLDCRLGWFREYREEGGQDAADGAPYAFVSDDGLQMRLRTIFGHRCLPVFLWDGVVIMVS